MTVDAVRRPQIEEDLMSEPTPTASSRTALVTGAASGIGRSIAQHLHEVGYRIVALDRSADVEAIAAVAHMVVDLTDRAQIADAVTRLHAEGIEIDVLVNCAGVQPQAADRGKNYVADVDDATWDLTMAVNLTAPFLLSRAFVPRMQERGWGRVINIVSRAGQTYVPSTTVDYSASKSGLIGFTRMLAGEGGPHGVTVNAVAPGRISTPLANAQSDESIAASLTNVPMGRIGDVSEVAAVVAFLVSDAAGYITGATIPVNGGAHMP